MIELEAFERSPELSELRVGYRRKYRETDRQLTSPLTAEAYLRSIWNRDTIELYEDFILVCLNNGNQPLGWVRISSGSYSYSAVDPKLIFGIALQTASSALIVAHNHPSGNLEPSAGDRALTCRLVDCGKLLSIRVLDHIIITKDSSLSFQARGLMPESEQAEPLLMRNGERPGGAASE